MRTWLPIEICLVRHRKTRALARAWQCHPYTVVGFLVELWGYCLEHQPDGDTTQIPDEDLTELARPCLASAIGVVPDVRQALRRAGFLEKSGKCHDWAEYAGRIIRRRAEARKRMRHKRKRTAVRSPNGSENGSPNASRTFGSRARTLQHSTAQHSRKEQAAAREVPSSRSEPIDNAAAASGEPVGVLSPDRLSYAQRCTIAANRGLHAALGDAVNELVAGVQAAPLDWEGDGIPIEVAEHAIEQRARAYRPAGRNRQPRSLRYFDGAVRDAWDLAQRSAPTSSSGLASHPFEIASLPGAA